MRRLGQHFLVSREAAGALAAAAGDAMPHEVVAEVGTGRGFLTGEILRSTRALVVSVELDPALCGLADAARSWRLELVCGDALSVLRRFDYLVASLPYYLSSRFVEWLSTMAFKRAAVLLQEEFARKLVAGPGDEGYGAVAAFSRIALSAELGARVGPQAFRPRPKVGSRAVFIRPRRLMTRREARWAMSSLRRLFSFRGKLVRSTCRSAGLQCEGDGRRVEDLGPREALAIAAALSA